MGMTRSFCLESSMATRTWTDDSRLKGKALSSTRFLGRYRKYLPSFLLNILPLASATILGYLSGFAMRKRRVRRSLFRAYPKTVRLLRVEMIINGGIESDNWRGHLYLGH